MKVLEEVKKKENGKMIIGVYEKNWKRDNKDPSHTHRLDADIPAVQIFYNNGLHRES